MVRVVELDVAAHQVVHDGGALGHTEAQHAAGAWAEATVAGVAVVAAGASRLGPLLDLLRREIAVVRVACLEQPLGSGDVRGRVLALEVRALERGIVAVDADPRQGVDDALRPLRSVAGFVGVLDAEDERAAEPLGERPVVERRARPTDVEETGGRWREAKSRAAAHVPFTLPATPFSA